MGSVLPKALCDENKSYGALSSPIEHILEGFFSTVGTYPITIIYNLKITVWALWSK